MDRVPIKNSFSSVLNYMFERCWVFRITPEDQVLPDTHRSALSFGRRNQTNLKKASSEFLQLLPQLVSHFREPLTLLVFKLKILQTHAMTWTEYTNEKQNRKTGNAWLILSFSPWRQCKRVDDTTRTTVLFYKKTKKYYSKKQ